MTTPRRRSDFLAALALDPFAYAAIARRASALPVALGIVVVASLLGGVGGLLWTQVGGRPPANTIFTTDIARFIRRSVLAGSALQVVLWSVLVLVVWVYLRAFGERVGLATLARVLGYAFAPMAFMLFVFPPGLEMAAGALACGYTFCAMVTAVRAGAGTTPGRALIAVFAGFALFVIGLALLGNGTTDLAPGVFALDPLPISVGTRPR